MAEIMRTVKKKFENVVIDRKIKEFENSATGQLLGGKNGLDNLAYSSLNLGEKLGVTKNITVSTDVKDKSLGATKGDQPSNDVYMDSILRMAGKNPNFASSRFPLENSLEKFASVNFIMSLGAISSQEMNFPDTSYKIHGIKDGQLILRSGGFSTDDIGNRKPRIYAEGLYGIDTAYFIDDLNIEEVVSPTRRVRTTNSTNFSMKIHEPYSMGNFLQTLKLASFNAGYDNYLQAVYLLMIETIGYDDNGKVIRGETRHFPINIYDVQFDTSTQGSVYDLSAIPCNESALSDVYQCIKADITVSGKTVEEMLQSGLNSLATNINTNQLNNRVEKKQGEATIQADTDEYIVLFPKDSTSKRFQQFSSTFSNKAIEGDFAFKEFTLEQAFGTNGKFEQYPSTGFRIQGEDFSPSVEQQMTDYAKAQSGWSVKRSNLSEGIKQKFTGIQGEVNSIGRSKIQIEDPLSGNNKVPFGIPNFAYDQKTGIMKRGRTSINTTEKTIQFTKGTKIEKIIEELVILSEYGAKINNEGVIKDRSGWIEWFRIETAVFALDGKDTEELLGRKARIYVYKVVPYLVHRSVFMMPNDPPVGWDTIKAQACKHYNYLYTGTNKDVLDFQLRFNNAFFQAYSNDMNNRGGNNSLAEGGNLVVPVEKELQGNTNSVVPEGRRTEKVINATGSLETGGGATETPDLRVARAFNEALMNSDTDLIELQITIMGDLYFLTDSGQGNYVSEGTQYLNLKADGQMDHQSGQVDVVVNFRTPLDISPEGVKFDGQTIGVKDFSGLYQVTQVNSVFSGNEFRQELLGVRRRNQGKPIQVADILFVDKKARQRRIEEAEANGDIFDIAFAKADINGDGKLTPMEEQKAIALGVQESELEKARIVAQGKVDKARTKVKEEKRVQAKRLAETLGIQ
jgi:hypothetical protein